MPLLNLIKKTRPELEFQVALEERHFYISKPLGVHISSFEYFAYDFQAYIFLHIFGYKWTGDIPVSYLGATAYFWILHDTCAYFVHIYAYFNLHIMAYFLLCLFKYLMHICAYKHIFMHISKCIFMHILFAYLCIFIHMVCLHICAYFGFAYFSKF